MKITLKKDVLTPDNGVGRAGQTIEVSQAAGHDYITADLAVEAAADAEATKSEGASAPPAKAVTHDTLKENKDAKKRETK